MSSPTPPVSRDTDYDDENEGKCQYGDKAGQEKDLSHLKQNYVSSSLDGPMHMSAEVIKEAKLFTQLASQHEALRAEQQQKLNSVRITQEKVEYLASALDISKADAGKILRINNDDVEKATLSFITTFPHLDIYRQSDQVLG